MLTPAQLRKPTLEKMRQRLGGPRDEAGALREREGTLWTYKGEAALVLHEGPATGAVDLWLGEGRAVRGNSRDLAPLTTPASPAMSQTAADLRVFLDLLLDSRVTFLTADGAILRGKLIERCRFGGLVALDEGAVLGVGFARFLETTSAGGTDQHLA